MKTLVVYDSLYGNTEKIAWAIGRGIESSNVKILRAAAVNPADLEGVELLFVGSPTQGGRATRPVQDFLAGIPDGVLRNVRAASFDTRLKTRLVKVFGYAAERIENALKEKGGTVATPAGIFFVKGSKGPLEKGEEERAAEWARGIVRGEGQAAPA
jgi:flavodoxin I